MKKLSLWIFSFLILLPSLALAHTEHSIRSASGATLYSDHHYEMMEGSFLGHFWYGVLHLALGLALLFLAAYLIRRAWDLAGQKSRKK